MAHKQDLPRMQKGRAMTKFRIPLEDEELELIEEALRFYSVNTTKLADRPRCVELAEKIADADEEVGHG
jgi:hypothetical protein